MRDNSQDKKKAPHVAAVKQSAVRPSRLRAYLVIFLLTLAGGTFMLLKGDRYSMVSSFDVTLMSLVVPLQNSIYDVDTEQETVTSSELTFQSDRARKFHLVKVNDDPNQIYENTPPSALDYAVMLHALHEKRVNNVVLTTNMAWDSGEGLSAQALSNKLDSFSQATISLPLTRGASAQEMPDILRRSMIPLSNVKGNIKLIPSVNQVSIPTAITDSDQVSAGFSVIESLPVDEKTIPSICIWEGEGVIPSIELLALMRAHEVLPIEVIINCGKYIRLGDEGPLWSIGDYGEVELHTSDQGLSSYERSIEADQLIIDSREGEVVNADGSDVYLVYATGEKTKSTNMLSSNRLAGILYQSQFLPMVVAGSSTPYRRAPIWAEVAIILMIGVTACSFLELRGARRLLPSILTGLGMLLILLILMRVTQHWTSSSTLIVSILTAWISSLFFPFDKVAPQDHSGS